MFKRSFGLLLLALLFAISVVSGPAVQAQTSNQATDTDEVNLDTQLYLIVGTNQDVADSKMPAVLDNVIKQMRATLPYKNYRLATTLLNRVKNEGQLNSSWIGGPLGAPTAAATDKTPSFSQFKVRIVKLVRGSDGQQMVQLAGFNYGARIPIQNNSAVAANGTVMPTFNYENTGVTTDISVKENEPVIVGTLNMGPSGDALILVVSAKRTGK